MAISKDPQIDEITKNPIAIYAPNPQGLIFDSQEKGEKIVLLLRAHPITFFPSIVTLLVLILAPLFVPFVFNFLNIDISSAFSPIRIILVVAFWYLFAFGYGLYKFIFWYFNVYLLTDRRIVDFDLKGILHKEFSYAYLNQIQDVSPKVIGFFGTFFHFGNVFVQTAAQKPEFEFHHVENLDLVSRAILKQLKKYKKFYKGARDAD